MKYILVIGDGMADHPLDTLGGRTPLEASKKDAIDALARHGILGSVRNVPEGFAPGSDTAIMSIFGCSPRKYFFGRAPLEAAASGIRLAPGDACYRCNMVTYADEDVPFEHKHIISHSAGSIEGRESDELVTMLFDHPDFRPLAEQAGMVIHKGSSFRHLAVQSHVDIKGIQLAPPHDHLGDGDRPHPAHRLPERRRAARAHAPARSTFSTSTRSTSRAAPPASSRPTASGSGPRARRPRCRTSPSTTARTAASSRPCRCATASAS